MARLHHLSAFTLVACLVYEFVAFRKSLTAGEVRLFEKGASFYGANPMFWTKMALFTIVGLLSIYPTIRYIRWGTLNEGAMLEVPEEEHKRIRLMLNLEIIGLVLILFAAPAMARAIGMS